MDRVLSIVSGIHEKEPKVVKMIYNYKEEEA
jgi:hypothetical protein